MSFSFTGTKREEVIAASRFERLMCYSTVVLKRRRYMCVFLYFAHLKWIPTKIGFNYIVSNNDINYLKAIYRTKVKVRSGYLTIIYKRNQTRSRCEQARCERKRPLGKVKVINQMRFSERWGLTLSWALKFLILDTFLLIKCNIQWDPCSMQIQ